jgi:hypothetical protein
MCYDAEHSRPDEEPNRQEWQWVDPLDRLLDHDEGRAEEERRDHQRCIGLPARCRNGLGFDTLLRGERDGGFGHGTSHPASTRGLAVLPLPCPEGQTLGPERRPTGPWPVGETRGSLDRVTDAILVGREHAGALRSPLSWRY